MIEEVLPPDESVDVMNSNCVLNLGPDKTPVFAEMARVLRPQSADGPFAPKVAHRRIEDTHIETSRRPQDWLGNRQSRVVEVRGGPHRTCAHNPVGDR